MWNLNDETSYRCIASFELPWPGTHGSMHPEKRERIRKAAIRPLPERIPQAQWWAFRIFVRNRHARFDIENVLKLIVDSFCVKMIEKDHSDLKVAGLFQDDTLDYVKVLQIAGERSSETDATKIEIFARIDA